MDSLNICQTNIIHQIFIILEFIDQGSIEKPKIEK